jgi:L-seryl-tRNA(Ser) seleniumtransferase
MTPETRQAGLRKLPAVGDLLASEPGRHLEQRFGRAAALRAAREAIDDVRQAVLAGRAEAPDEQHLWQRVHAAAERNAKMSLRPVINATGIVLHTGLGRAPLPRAAIEAIVQTAGRYSSLELDLETGRRGSRLSHVTGLLCELTGAPAALVVNNNAAATLLILAVLARDREVIVSRGQLIEIGGSYRLPDVMAASGAILREVGTTNRTRLEDYRKAIGPQTAMLLHVHTSNYRIVGFSESVPTADLARLAHEHGLICYDDLGSGALGSDLADEPNVADSLAAGADVVSFSGDKLLGGPQAGVILGRAELIEQIYKSPLMRTYRLDKLTLAAMEATLRLHLDPELAAEQIPTLAMLRTPAETLRRRAQQLAKRLKGVAGLEVVVESDESFAGGGSMPARPLPTWVVAVRAESVSAEELAKRLRAADPPVIGRVQGDRLLFDVRTLSKDELPVVADQLTAAQAG